LQRSQRDGSGIGHAKLGCLLHQAREALSPSATHRVQHLCHGCSLRDACCCDQKALSESHQVIRRPLAVTSMFRSLGRVYGAGWRFSDCCCRLRRLGLRCGFYPQPLAAGAFAAIAREQGPSDRFRPLPTTSPHRQSDAPRGGGPGTAARKLIAHLTVQRAGFAQSAGDGHPRGGDRKSDKTVGSRIERAPDDESDAAPAAPARSCRLHCVVVSFCTRPAPRFGASRFRQQTRYVGRKDS
jgi:hypothetical protein